jgi:hypothetical protein
VLLLSARPAHAQPDDVDPQTRERIAESISRGVEWLKQANRDGMWHFTQPMAGIPHEQNIGATALAAIALLEAKADINDEYVKRALNVVRAHASRLSYTYSASMAIVLLEREIDKDGNHANGTQILELARRLADAQDRSGGWGYGGGAGGGADNSNTQFALVGLWVSRRHAPCKAIAEPCILRAAERFRRSQNPGGGWGYVEGGLLSGPTVSMTSAGLLALGMEHALRQQQQLSRAELIGGDAGTTPGKPPAKPAPIRPPWETDPAVINGFKFLEISFPKIDGGYDHATYALWSVERVCMVFRKRKIADVQWYPFGARILMDSQKSDGSWSMDHRHGPVVDTALALLFLTQSNLIGDPFQAILKSGGKYKELVPPRPDGGAGAAKPAERKELTEAEVRRLGTELLTASGPNLDDVLEKLENAKSSAVTQVLHKALVSNEVRDINKVLIRRTLAQRFRRLVDHNIRYYLTETDREFRLAAATAAGLKGSGYLVVDLIPLVMDRDRDVALAAQASLKTLTNQDFGRNADAWLKWWQEKGSKTFSGDKKADPTAPPKPPGRR